MRAVRSTASTRRPRARRGGTPPPGGTRVVVLTAGVGAGHDGPAAELAARLRARGCRVDVHDYLDALPAPVRRVLADGYGMSVNHLPRFFDRLFDDLEHRTVLQGLTLGVCRLAEHTVLRWTAHADVVVSTFPLAGQTLGRLRATGRLRVPAVSYLTDPAPHRMWVHPSVDVHLCVTLACADAARDRYAVDVRAVGPLVAPAFSRGRVEGACDVRRDLGVGTDLMVLLSAGSLALGDVPAMAAAVLEHPAAHVVVLCGRNRRLREQLAGDPRVTALAWRDDVPALMAAADVLLHNAGGLSVTEALVANLPTVTFRPIPGHGRANATVLAGAGLAAWPADTGQLVEALDACRGRERTVSTPWPMAPGAPDAAGEVLDLVRAREPATLRAA